MSRREVPARLLILGEGADRPRLEALCTELGVEDDALMPGFVSNPYPYMARAGVFVLSSRFEGLPTVLIEAAGVGAPIVATDCESGPREILRGGKFGSLVPVGDPESMARAITQVLREPSRYIVPLEALEAFSLESIVPRYLQALGLGYLTKAAGSSRARHGQRVDAGAWRGPTDG